MTRIFSLLRGQALKPIRRCDQGAALVEFALILPALLMFVMGALEIGYRVYAVSVVNGSLREAARMASTGGYTGAEIDQKVTSMIRDWRSTANVAIVKRSYSDFTGVGLPEPITSGTVESGTYCYQDINKNNIWDADRGADGLGGAEDVIYYEVTMTYPTLMKFTQKAFGLGAVTTVKQNTIVSNEPFAAVVRTPPPTVCK